jgi:hypothetical protein
VVRAAVQRVGRDPGVVAAALVRERGILRVRQPVGREALARLRPAPLARFRSLARSIIIGLGCGGVARLARGTP